MFNCRESQVSHKNNTLLIVFAIPHVNLEYLSFLHDQQYVDPAPKKHDLYCNILQPTVCVCKCALVFAGSRLQVSMTSSSCDADVHNWDDRKDDLCGAVEHAEKVGIA